MLEVGKRVGKRWGGERRPNIIESVDVGSARGSVETLRGSRLEHLAEAMSDPPMDKSNKANDDTPFNDTLVSPC